MVSFLKSGLKKSVKPSLINVLMTAKRFLWMFFYFISCDSKAGNSHFQLQNRLLIREKKINEFHRT